LIRTDKWVADKAGRLFRKTRIVPQRLHRFIVESVFALSSMRRRLRLGALGICQAILSRLYVQRRRFQTVSLNAHRLQVRNHWSAQCQPVKYFLAAALGFVELVFLIVGDFVIQMLFCVFAQGQRFICDIAAESSEPHLDID
jgi:hypothetical protein